MVTNVIPLRRIGFIGPMQILHGDDGRWYLSWLWWDNTREWAENFPSEAAARQWLAAGGGHEIKAHHDGETSEEYEARCQAADILLKALGGKWRPLAE